MVGPRRTRGRRSSGGSAGGMPRVKYAPVREKLDIKDADLEKDTIKVAVPTKDGKTVERTFSLVRHPSPYAKTESGAAASEPSKPASEPPPKATRQPIWTTEVVGDSVIVKSPYHPSLPEEFKKINGRWDPSRNVWVIPARYKDKVESVLTERLGANDEERVDMRIKTDGLDLEHTTSFRIGQYSISRPSRDWSVRKSDNIAIIEGGFPQSGGSMKHPRLEPLPGTVLEIRGVPKSIAEKTKAKYGDNVEIVK